MFSNLEQSLGVFVFTAIFDSVNLVHFTRARGSVIINIFPISHCSVFTLLPKSEIWISFRF